MKKLLKIVFRLILIAIIFIIIAISFIYIKLNKLQIQKISSDLYISNNARKLDQYENIALFAVDSRDIKSNKNSRSDGIIIISINKKNKDIKLCSIYRDTYVDIPNHGYDKITHAYAFGRPELSIQTLNLNFDLNIKKYITVNFLSVANIVDKLGEIQVEINDEELKELNKYIPDTMENTGLKSNLLVSSGLKSLDGVQAVTYARIRKITGGDYARASRMRTVIIKVFEKLKKSDLKTINETFDIAISGIQTNILKHEIIYLISNFYRYKIVDTYSFPFEFKEVTLNAFYEIPDSLVSNVKQLHKKLFNQEDYLVSDKVLEISKNMQSKLK